MGGAVIPLVERGRWKQEMGAGAVTGEESLRTEQKREVKHPFRLPFCTGGKDVEGGGGGSASCAFYAGRRTGRGHSRSLQKDEMDVLSLAAL